MKKLLLLCFLFSGIYGFSQDTIFLDKKHKPVSQTAAEYFQVLEKNSTNSDAGWKRTYLMSGQIMSEEFYSSFEKESLEGKKRTWKKEGKLHTEADFQNDIYHGHFISYWENGQMKRKDAYKKGKWKEGTTWDPAGKKIKWYPMEQKPVFPGGQKALVTYLKKNAKKPKEAAGGRVVVSFVVDVDGTVTDIKIKESTSMGLNYAAYELVAKMPLWEPGKQDGEPVRVIYALPLNFQ